MRSKSPESIKQAVAGFIVICLAVPVVWGLQFLSNAVEGFKEKRK